MIILLLGCDPQISDVQTPVENTPPELLDLSWSTSSITTDESLSIHTSARDLDGTQVELLIEWTVNGVPLDVNDISLDGTLYFDRGDAIAVTVTPSDGRDTGLPLSLSPLIVDNTPPTVPEVVILPTEPVASIDTLICLASCSDPDNDETTFRYSWLLDGVEISTEPVLLPTETTAADLTCQVWASDDVEEGTATEAVVTPRSASPTDLDPYIQPGVYVTPEDLSSAESVIIHYGGELIGSKTMTMRYGVDGKYNHDDIEQEQLTNALAFTRDVEMSWTGDEWQVEIELPADVTALHMLFFNEDFTDEDDVVGLDNRDDLEYHRSRSFPYIPPYLTWDDSVTPSDGIVVSFETDIPCLGVVAYGTDPDELDNLLAGEIYDTLHHIPLTDLEPETTYYYTVHDSAGHESEVYSFTTTPDEFTTFTLLVMADLQDNGTEDERWPEVAATIIDNHPEIDLILMPGDMTADDFPWYWWLLFEGGKNLFPNVPMLPVLGNHETPTGKSSSNYTSFARYFELPRDVGNEAYYAQTYGNTRFLNFNSEIPEEFSETGDQFMWAEEETAMLWDGLDPVYDWVFAAWHTPVYNVGRRFAGNQYSFRPVTELFDGYVDWVFTGHEQLYQRTQPVHYPSEPAASGSYGVMSDDGVGYMVVPAAGNHLWDKVVDEDSTGGEVRELLAYPQLADGQIEVEVEHGYVIIEIEGRTMNMTVWGMGNADTPLDLHVRDAVSYTKP